MSCCPAGWSPNALARVWPRLDEDTRWLLEARYILDYSDSELAREPWAQAHQRPHGPDPGPEKGPGLCSGRRLEKM